MRLPATVRLVEDRAGWSSGNACASCLPLLLPLGLDQIRPAQGRRKCRCQTISVDGVIGGDGQGFFLSLCVCVLVVELDMQVGDSGWIGSQPGMMSEWHWFVVCSSHDGLVFQVVTTEEITTTRPDQTASTFHSEGSD